MNLLKATGAGLVIFIAACGFALADDVPSDCLASFKVKDQKLSADVNWLLATGSNASMSCAAAELLREKLFIDGNSKLSEADLSGSPDDAQQKALAAYDTLQAKIENLSGDDVPGSLFAALGYLIPKYELAECILTVAAEGGTCWKTFASFVLGISGFGYTIYQNQSNSLQKQEVLAALQKLKPPISSLRPGQADLSGARSRWIRTQTQLCRAVQQGCL